MKKFYNRTDANTDASDILENLFNSDEKCYELSEWNMWQSSNQDWLMMARVWYSQNTIINSPGKS